MTACTQATAVAATEPASEAEAVHTLRVFLRQGRHLWSHKGQEGLCTVHALNRLFTEYTGWEDAPGLAIDTLRQIDPEMARAMDAVCPRGDCIDLAGFARSVEFLEARRRRDLGDDDAADG